MKKLVCAILSLLLAAMFCAVSLADTYTVDVDYEGEYVTFDDTFSLYIPNTFADSEITADMEESGIFAYYLDEENGVAMAVQWILPDNSADLEAAGNELANDPNYANVTSMTFNSIPFITYDSATQGSFGCMCADGTEDGGFYIFSFAPDDDATSTLALKIMASIQ